MVLRVHKALKVRQVQLAQPVTTVLMARMVPLELPEQPGLLEPREPQVLLGHRVLKALPVITERTEQLALLVQPEQQAHRDRKAQPVITELTEQLGQQDRRVRLATTALLALQELLV